MYTPEKTVIRIKETAKKKGSKFLKCYQHAG